MIVLDVCLGPTHQNRGRQSSWSECWSRFCCGQIQPPEKQTQPVVGRKSSTFHLDCGQRPAWGWWWIRWQSGKTGPCLPSSRQSQHSPAVESSESSKSGRKRIPHQFKRWQVWWWGWCESGRSSHVAPTILAKIRFKRSRGGKKRSKGYRGKKIRHVFSTCLDKADVPKVGAKDQSVNVRLRCKTWT